MKSIRTLVAGAAALLILAVVLAACGGGGSSSATEAASSGGSTEAAGGEAAESGGAEAAESEETETVNVGTIASLANIGGTFNGYNAGVKAFFEYWNSKGGIDGYTFNLTAKDDGGDPGKSAQEARALVQEDGVVAIVGEASLADAATQKYFESEDIPVIGGWATSSAWQSPATNMFVNLEGPNQPYCTVWSNNTAKAMGVKSMVDLAQDFPAAIQDGECREAGAKNQGIEVAGPIIKASLTQASYNPLIQQAISTGAEAIYFSTGADGQIAGIEAGEQLGYEGTYIATQASGLLEPLSKYQESLNGRVVTDAFSLLPNDPDSYSPELAHFKEGMKEFQPKYAEEIPAVTGWAAGVMFAHALKEAGPDPKAILEFMQGLENYEFEGLQGPMTYTEGSKPNECTLPLVMENGEWVRAKGAEKPPKFSCYELIDKDGKTVE